MKWSIEKIKLDLVVNWKISRNESLFKENYILKLQTKEGEFLGEAAPNIRYGESASRIEKDYQKLLNANENDHEELLKKLDDFHFCHSFRFACESAILRSLAFKMNKSLPDYLNLMTKKKVSTSFSIPIMQEDKIEDYLSKCERFHFLKLKINKDKAYELTEEVLKYMKPHQTLRIDGNETFLNKGECLSYLNHFRNEKIEFIEQPMPASQFQDYLELKKESPFPLMADESIEEDGDFSKLFQGFDYINVKLMKAGGLLNAIRLLKLAKEHGMKTMLGCMIETSLGIRDALYLSSLADVYDLDGGLLIKEDPFKYVQEVDGEIFY